MLPPSAEVARDAARPSLAGVRAETLAAGCAVAVMGSAMLSWPAGRDQGIEAATALAILDGAVPYRDVWNHSPPGGFMLAALAFSLFGRSELALRALDLLLLGASAALAFAFMRSHFGRMQAWTAALVMPLVYLALGPSDTAQRDGGLIPLGLGALLFAYPARGAARALLAGTLAGAAVLFKPGGAALVLAVAWVLRHDRRALGHALLGAVLIPGATLAWLAALGALGPAVECLVTFNRAYVDHYRSAAAAAGKNPAASALRLLAQAPLSWLSLLGVWHAWRTPQRSALLSFLAAAATAPLLQAGVYVYHLLPLLGPAALLGALGTAELRAHLPRRAWTAPVVVAVVLAVQCQSYVWQVATALGVDGRSPNTQVERAGFSHLELAQISSVIARRSAPKDRVLLWGPDGIVSLLSGRRLATRYVTNLPLRTETVATRERPRFLAALRAQLPRHVVVQRADRLEWLTGETLDSEASLATFPELAALLAERYRRVGAGETVILFERRDPAHTR